MIATTRREALFGAAAVPALAGLPRWQAQPSGVRLLVHDPALAAGRVLAAAHDGETLAIEGDRVRFGRTLFASRPAMVVGVSRPADALLIADVAREAGYREVDDGTDRLRAMIEATQPQDRGLVLGWVLAPRR
jgi:hypothetical protein